MGLLKEEKELKKFRTVKMTFEDDFDLSEQEIVLKSQYRDGISFNDLMNTFRQFLVALNYSEDAARMVRDLSGDDLDRLGLDLEDLSIVEYQDK